MLGGFLLYVLWLTVLEKVGGGEVPGGSLFLFFFFHKAYLVLSPGLMLLHELSYSRFLAGVQ